MSGRVGEAQAVAKLSLALANIEIETGHACCGLPQKASEPYARRWDCSRRGMCHARLYP